MAFNTAQNNGRDNQNNTNTRGPQFSNKNGFDPSTLQLSYWNEMISIRISPALEPSKQTETKVFDYEKTVSTAINIEKATMLISAIKEHIIPAIEAGENKDIAFSINGDSLMAIGTGKRLTGEIRPFVAIHKSLNPDTKKPEMSIFYEFKQNQYIDNYDEKTGSYNVLNHIHAEFITFYKCITASVLAMSNAFVHSSRMVNKYFNDKLSNNVLAIANKVGADVGYTSNKSTYSRNNVIDFNSGHSSQPTTTQPAETANVNRVGSLEEFESMLEDY